MRLAAALLACLALLPSAARAHGSFPVAYDVHRVAGASGPELRVESNFGIARPTSEGWRLLCEEAVSPGVKWFRLDGGGRIYMGSGSGLATSTDRCDFVPARDSSTAIRWLERVPLASGDAPPAVVALLDVYVPGRNLQVSLDDGATVSLLASPEGLLVNAIRADAFAPGLLHATAQVAQGEYGYLVHDFATGTWSTPIPLEIPGIPRVIGATATAVFFRAAAPEGPSLWRLAKGETTPAKVLDLVKGSEPSTAFFSPLADGLWIGNTFETPLVSTDDGLTFAPGDAPESTNCLHDFDGVRYACVFSADAANAPVLQRTPAGWVPVMRWQEIVGMEECPSSTEVGQACPDIWYLVETFLNPGGTGEPEPPETDPPPGCPGCDSAGFSLLSALALGLRRRSPLAARAPAGRPSAPVA